jgi:uncharacterized protein (TIGR02058 family)
MPKTRVALEIGHGTSLRRMDYTAAARRAIQNALWRNSLTVASAFGFPKEAMIVDVEIAVAAPEQVDTNALKNCFPYGQIAITVSQGGLNITKPNSDDYTVIANAAIIVSFDMELA